MIEKIYIPTIARSDSQITYNNLPPELQKRVIMVVQHHEREQYNYPVEYLEVGDNIGIAKTREIIFNHAMLSGRDCNYAVIDDDITFSRRNSKYWSKTDNMEKSKRYCTENDVLEMFEQFDSWLESGYTLVGCGHPEHPPSDTQYTDHKTQGSCGWYNGKLLHKALPEIDLCHVEIAEDMYLLLELFTKGHRNRVSNEFVFHNNSVYKKSLKSEIWDNQDKMHSLEQWKKIEAKFPEFVTVLGTDGGFRAHVKVRVKWRKAYRSSQVRYLKSLFGE